uniref:5'-nucleotidase SurE n=1 Tax=Magnetococcus massalia (strain MO-1) TaxID=451514 RepID=A0A1S7LMV8_MAGMO|nr:5'-nucleotidase surE [Candidatus Magnetococcus massalia]
MLILLTNDDGIQSPGLHVLRDTLSAQHEVVVVAPARDMSGTGHGLTRGEEVRLQRISEREIAVTGTPTDCIMAALRHVLNRPPDLLISGVNLGGNLAEDISYSATVGAAWEGALSGIPSIAVSLDGHEEPWQFETAERVTRTIMAQWINHPLPPGTFLNVNIPNVPEYQIKGLKATRQGLRFQWPDPPMTAAGTPAFWNPELALRTIEHSLPSDARVVKEGYVSVTALYAMFRHPNATESLQAWPLFR